LVINLYYFLINIYKILIYLHNFTGHYSWFENNEYFIDLTIKECVYEMYLYQNRDSSYLKSWYIHILFIYVFVFKFFVNI